MEDLSLLNSLTGEVVGGGDGSVESGTPAALRIPDDLEDDDASFFDLEFTIPNDDDDKDPDAHLHCTVSSATDDPSAAFSTPGELFFQGKILPLQPSPMSSATSLRCTVSSAADDPSAALSTPGELFFQGKILPLQPSPMSSATSVRPQFPVNLLKSATKFRVFLLGFKKPKPSATAHPDSPTAAAEAKRLAKVVLQKYLKAIKPLYVRVSRKYVEKMRFSGQPSFKLGKTSPAPAPAVGESPPPAVAKRQRQGNLPAGLQVVCRHLGKSRSASAAVGAAPAPRPTWVRDDLVLQEEDGIQSAIAHCKKSLHGLKESELLLTRCASDPIAGTSRNREQRL